MANFKFSFHFFEDINIWHFFLGILVPHGTLWCHRWVQVLKILPFWLHHQIPHDESIVNTKFQIFIRFPWEVINIRPFLGYGPKGPCDVTDGSKFWKYCDWLQHGTPHDKRSLNAKFQHFIPFLWEDINIWLLLGILGCQGTMWRHRWVQVLKSLRFWLHHRILHD